jgi:hypothetical protein
MNVKEKLKNRALSAKEEYEMIKTPKLVMIPGPTPVTRSIQDQMGRETVAFGDPFFVQDYKDVLADLKELWKCSGEVFVVAGSGTLAMEMAIANITKRGDSVLICSNGYFGDRFIDMCQRKGLEVDVLSAKWGTSVTAEEVEKKLSEKKYDVVTVTHVETSTGAAAPIDAIGKVVKAHGALYVVDGVAASAGAEEYMDPMGIDVLLSCTQKAFGVAPGLAILWASKEAVEKRRSLGTIPESYADFEKWLPVMHDPSKYWGTPAINHACSSELLIPSWQGREEECFETDNTGLRKSLEILGFPAGGTVKSKIYIGLSGGCIYSLLKYFRTILGRGGNGHFKDCGNASSSSCCCFRLEGSSLTHFRLSNVYMGIDSSRKDKISVRIHFFLTDN